MSSSAKLIAGAFARDRALDFALGSLGVSAALVSASFAAYMVFVGPEYGARGDRPLISALPVPTHPPLLSGGPVPASSGPSDSIDFTPTGTVPIAEAAPRTTPRIGATAVLKDFAVRDVFDGTALVEADGALQMVTPGATLEGAGEVLAIERQRGAWIVRTAGGIIRQRR